MDFNNLKGVKINQNKLNYNLKNKFKLYQTS